MPVYHSSFRLEKWEGERRRVNADLAVLGVSGFRMGIRRGRETTGRFFKGAESSGSLVGRAALAGRAGSAFLLFIQETVAHHSSPS